MMNMQCGVDIIEVNRIEKAIEELGENFLNKIYTQKEIEYCCSKNKMKYQHYAARYAAKEAVFKAISSMLGYKYDISWKDIEILNKEDGKPYVIIHSDKLSSNYEIDISMSHIKEYAIANCIIQIKE